MRFRFASCLLMVCMTAPVGAAAQPAASPSKSDAKTDEARELFIRGMALYEQGQYERAEAALLASWSLKKHYQIAGNLGVCEMKLGKYRNAAEHLSVFLKELPPAGDQQDRKRAQALLDEARTKVAVVKIGVDVDGAEVRVDGQVIGAAPLAAEVFVEPGKRTVEAARGGYENTREVIDAKAGASLSVSLKLRPSAPPPLTPPSDQSKRLSEIGPPVMSARPNRKVLIAGGAVAGAALVSGLVFTVLANGKAGAGDEKRDMIRAIGGSSACLSEKFAADCDALHGLRKDYDTFANISVWSFIAAGAVGAATLIYAFSVPRSRPLTAVRLSPTFTAQGGGVVVSSSW